MTLISYIIFVNIYILLFGIVYKLLLQKQRQYKLNRLFLISALLLPFILPYFHNTLSELWLPLISTTTPLSAINLTILLDAVTITSKGISNTFDWQQVVQLILALGSGITLLYFIVGHYRIRSIMQKAKIEKTNKINLFLSQTPITPFSYNRCIVIPQSIPNEEREMIIFHESLHIRYGHYVDTYLLQVLQIVLWINPFFYLLKNDLKQVHEFQVDDHIINSGIDAITYKLTLLKFSVGSHKFQIANGLTNCPIKKRLIMMNTPNARKNNWRYFLALPLMTLATLVLSSSTNVSAQKAIEEITVVAKDKPAKTTEVKAETPKQVEPKEETPEDVFEIVEHMPSFPGGVKALMKFLSENTNYPVEAQTKGIQGRVYVNFIVSKDGTITNAKIKRGVAPMLDKEALRVINSMPKWKPGTQRGKIVNVSYNIPVNFTLR